MRRLAVLAACSLLALAGCGGGSGHSAGAATTSGTASAGGAMPTVSGSYGDKPTITFPSSAPAKTLQKKVLSEGSGPAVAKGDLLVADYLGQIWNGKVFDNSYDRGQPAAFQIGAGKVIPGWDEGLVGVKAGSRVLLVIPPDKGYGSSGNPQAGIKGTDTLVFVVDVVQSYGKNATGDPKAVPQHASTGGVKVGGQLGARPTVSVTKGAKPPTKPHAVLLAKGHGKPVTKGLIIVQYEAVTWAGQSAGSTWQEGAPAGVPVGSGSPFDQLVGMPVGSRVLITVPAQKGADPTKQSIAAVVDIVAQVPPAKATASK